MKVELKQFCKIIQGGRHKKSGKDFVDDGGYPAYGAGGLNGYLSDWEFEKPAIVLSAIGARCGKCFLPSNGPWSSLANTQIIFPDAEVADIRFIWYQLNDEMSWIRRGTGQPYIRPADVKTRQVYFPSLAEQRRIAAILDKADAIRRKRQQALALANDLLRSSFLEMFGDFFVNPMKWPMAPLGELIKRGPQNGLYKPSKDYGSGTPIVRIDSFYDGKIHGLSRLKRVRLNADEVATYLLDQDDILINRVNSRSHLGKCALVPQMSEPTVFESNMMRLSVDTARLHPVYLTRVLQSPFLNEQIQRRAKDAVNQASINQGDVTSFVIPLPPLAEQQKFVDADAMISASLPRRQQAHLEAESLFASLSQRAFGGRL